MKAIEHRPEGIVFSVSVQPRSSKNAIAGRYGDSLKIRLQAPPVDGAANKACLKFLGKLLGVAPSRLEMISGHGSRQKRVLCRCGNTPGKGSRESVERLLQGLYSEPS
jgi:uncharacterized protein (TIGR00251 family)